MTAAHELIERGYTVSLYEMRDSPGGKARSMNVPGTATGGRPPLPCEHGFRFFPGFYQHLPETMERIRFPDNTTVRKNLVEATRIQFAFEGSEPAILLPRLPKFPTDTMAMANGMYDLTKVGLTIEDVTFFAVRIWQLLTSCEDRRKSQYERISWWDFLDADNRSIAYQRYMGGMTRSLVAARGTHASTKTIGDIALQLLFDSITHTTDRLLNGPTNDVWINPWHDYLNRLQCGFMHTGIRLVSLECDSRQITSAVICERNAKETSRVKADYYIVALPVDRVAPLLGPYPGETDGPSQILRLDPSLAYLRNLSLKTEWMNGIQFYLNRDVPVVHGHVVYMDSKWALSSVSQAQFWKGYNLQDYGDGNVRGIISVDISDWDTPGANGLPAQNSPRGVVAGEVWRQLKAGLNSNGTIELRDSDLHSWYLDPGITCTTNPDGTHQDENCEPMLVNEINTWQWRPHAYTAIPNLFLAGDYVRTNTDLATMEAANEAGRHAANSILERSNYKGDPCTIFRLHDPPFLAPWRKIDQDRYDQGLPWTADYGALLSFLPGVLSVAGGAVSPVSRLMRQVFS